MTDRDLLSGQEGRMNPSGGHLAGGGPAVLTIDRLSKTFGGVTAVDDVSLSVGHGEVHAVIGPNGAGKTTLISLLSGELKADSGTVRFGERNVTGLPSHARARLGMARSFQITSLMLDMTVLDNVMLAVQAHTLSAWRFWAAARRQTALVEPARDALQRVGLADRAHETARTLSHGEHRQLEIAIALATRPSLLLLDEPMAGMGAEESRRMITLLRGLDSAITMLLVEHDMDAVFTLAHRITVLVSGRAVASGDPREIRNDEAVRRAYLGEEDL